MRQFQVKDDNVTDHLLRGRCSTARATLWLSLRLRRYTPGVAIAALLVVPYSIYLFSHTP